MISFTIEQRKRGLKKLVTRKVKAIFLDHVWLWIIVVGSPFRGLMREPRDFEIIFVAVRAQSV